MAWGCYSVPDGETVSIVMGQALFVDVRPSLAMASRPAMARLGTVGTEREQYV